MHAVIGNLVAAFLLAQRVGRAVARILACVLLAYSGLAQGAPGEQVHEGPGIPDAGWVDIYFPIFDRVVAAAGLEPLREKRVADGGREVRVWIGGGIGYPQSLYRLIVDPDHNVRGELVWHWPNDGVVERLYGKSFHDLMQYTNRGSCQGFQLLEDVGTCRAMFESAPDWSQLLSEAAAAGLWVLPDPSELPDNRPPALDGWGITVELLDGVRYRTYHYSNPQLYEDWTEARKAVRVAVPFQALYDRIRPPDIEAVFSGAMDRHRSELRPCDGGPYWGLRSGLDHLVAEAGFVLPDSESDSYFVELRAEPAAEWLVKGWDTGYERILQSVRLESIRALEDTGCSGT